MPSNIAQLWLHNNGIKCFEDLTHKKWHMIWNYKQQGFGPSREQILEQLVTLALFYRNRIEHPEMYQHEHEHTNRKHE